MPITLSTGSFSTNEISERDEFSAQVGWTTEYLQLEPGQYHAEVAFSIHSNIRFAWSVSNLRSVVTAAPPSDHLAVFLPLANQPQIICQGRAMQQNEVAFISPNSKVVVRFPRNFEMITFTMTRADLKPKARRLVESHPVEFIEGVFATRFPKATIIKLKQICQVMIDHRMLPHSSGVINSIRKMELNISELLSDALLNTDGVLTASRARKNRVSTYFTARDYINGRLGTRLGIEAVAAEAGVSPRTLEYAFQDCLGINPLEYIKTRRLAEARRLLLGASPVESRVSDIAKACGFRRQGHFARDYSSRFLELPSQTLKNTLA